MLLGPLAALSLCVGFAVVRKGDQSDDEEDSSHARTTPPDYKNRALSFPFATVFSVGKAESSWSMIGSTWAASDCCYVTGDQWAATCPGQRSPQMRRQNRERGDQRFANRFCRVALWQVRQDDRPFLPAARDSAAVSPPLACAPVHADDPARLRVTHAPTDRRGEQLALRGLWRRTRSIPARRNSPDFGCCADR